MPAGSNLEERGAGTNESAAALGRLSNYTGITLNAEGPRPGVTTLRAVRIVNQV